MTSELTDGRGPGADADVVLYLARIEFPGNVKALLNKAGTTSATNWTPKKTDNHKSKPTVLKTPF